MTPPPLVRSLDVVSVVDQVTDEMRRSILSGDLQPGQEFSLRKIAEQLGVSLIPVREALKRLEIQGLVVTRRAKSAKVAPLEREEIRGIYRLRLTLEPDLAARACTMFTAAELDQLDVLRQAHSDAEDLDERHVAHQVLHVAMLRPAATSWDERILDLLWHASERYVRFAFAGLDRDPAEAERRTQAHVDLLAAFRTGVPHVAAQAYTQHLAYAQQVVLEAVDRVSRDDDGAAPRP